MNFKYFNYVLPVAIIIFGLSVSSQVVAQSLEQQVKQLEKQLQAIQEQLKEVRSQSAQEARKLDEVESLAVSAKADAAHQNRKENMVFFRGGFTHAMNRRSGSSIQSVVAPVGNQDTADKNGWYIGAGLDWNLTNNVWGFLPNTSVLAEVMFEYKEFSTRVLGNGGLANVPTMLAGGGVNPVTVTVSQFTLTAAPKIKFMEGSSFRPWIIPAGLALHVISPTSESVTYLAPGIMFAAGVDYNFWKDFYLGIDGRYHLTAGKADNVKVDGMTAGGYLGMGF